MGSRTPYQAYKNYIKQTESIIHCLPHARVYHWPEQAKLTAETNIDWELQDTSAPTIVNKLHLKNIGYLRMRQRAKIIDGSILLSTNQTDKYYVIAEEYLYDLEFTTGEIIS